MISILPNYILTITWTLAQYGSVLLGWLLLLLLSRLPNLGPFAITALYNFRRLAAQPLWATGLLIALLIMQYVVFYVVAVPYPRAHDEFGYLLGADTFVHGRLANSTPTVWEHFEALYIFFTPTYSPKYPPGQTLFLALGQYIAHSPIAGVWLSYSMAVVAVYWMLRGYTTPLAALVGGLLLALHGKMMYLWAMTFWGGAVAMLGSALLYGAFVRVVVVPSSRNAALLAMGLGLLAISRPFEGLLVAMPALVGVAIGLWRLRLPLRQLLWQVGLPFVVIIGLIGGFMLLHNRAVTGRYLTLPYSLYNPQYEVAKPFLFQAPTPRPLYRHQHIALHSDEEVAEYEYRRTVSGFMNRLVGKKYPLYANFLLGGYLIFPFFFGFWGRKRGAEWLVLAGLLTWLLGVSVATFEETHYSAPIAGLLLVFVVRGVRMMLVGPPPGRYLALAVLLTAVVQPIFGVLKYRQDSTQSSLRYRPIHQQTLSRIPNKHLVLVRYGTNHPTINEWVYNEADIANARIIWANDMGDSLNRVLIRQYHSRSVWLLRPDQAADQLIKWKPPNTISSLE